MEQKNKTLLPWSVILIISAAIFSGHFGVGDLIFPPILGRDSGICWLIAALGYGVINSLGVFIAYLAVSIQDKSLFGLASSVLGKNFGVVFTTLSMLIIGPVFILPRVSSATHEMAVAQFFPSIPIWVTLLIFFALNYYFAYNRSKVIDNLGKYLAPILIVFMVILVIKGIASPLASPAFPGSPIAFSEGILNGYNTMNALGASLFGLWLINEFNMRGVKTKESRKNNLIIIGSITAVGLFLSSTVLTYLGASSGAKFPDADIGILTVEFARGLLGYFGIIVFAIILTFANITTSIGLTSTAGDTFAQMTDGKLKYTTTVALSSIVGFLIGLIGLSKVVGYTVPWLMLIYPALVVILIMNLFSNFKRVKLATQIGTIVAILFSIGDFLPGIGFGNNFFTRMNSSLPLGNQGLAWLIPTVIALIAGLIFVKSSKSKPMAEGV